MIDFINSEIEKANIIFFGSADTKNEYSGYVNAIKEIVYTIIVDTAFMLDCDNPDKTGKLVEKIYNSIPKGMVENG